MQIYESQEDYLEKILMLTLSDAPVRSVDVAQAMGVTKPSVSIAMKLLRQKGLITMDDHNLIELTREGQRIASAVLERHKALARFFMHLGVDEDTAYKDACRIEHVISPDTFAAIRKLSEGYETEDGGQGNNV